MSKAINVRVTQKHIDEGCGGNLHFCPIAKAVRDAGFERVSVDGYIISIGQYGHGREEYKLPRIAKNFVVNFDNGDKVKPFTFTAKEYVW